MKRKPIIIALALLLMVSTAFAQMQGKGMNAQNKMKGENCRILTDEERDKVADAKRDFEKKAIPLRADIKVLKMELDDLLVSGKSGKELSAKLEDLQAAEAKLDKEQLDHKVEVRKIVGEEKFKQMQMFNKHMKHEKMQGMYGGKGGRKGDCQIHKGPNEYGQGGRQYYKQPVAK